MTELCYVLHFTYSGWKRGVTDEVLLLKEYERDKQTHQVNIPEPPVAKTQTPRQLNPHWEWAKACVFVHFSACHCNEIRERSPCLIYGCQVWKHLFYIKERHFQSTRFIIPISHLTIHPYLCQGSSPAFLRKLSLSLSLFTPRSEELSKRCLTLLLFTGLVLEAGRDRLYPEGLKCGCSSRWGTCIVVCSCNKTEDYGLHLML